MSKHVAKLLESCTNPAVGVTLIDLLGADLGKHELSRLNFEVSPGWARTIRRGRGQFLTEAAAGSPSSPEALDDLAFDSRKGVRRAVARNTNASPATLERLFRWGVSRDELTAKHAFGNRSLPPPLAFELFRWCTDDGASPGPLDAGDLLAVARRDVDTFREVFSYVAERGLRAPRDMVAMLSYSADEAPVADPFREAVFADLFPGGPLEGLVGDDVVSEVLKRALREHLRFGAAVVRAMVAAEFPLVRTPRCFLSERACVEVFDLGDVFRRWAVESPLCPEGLVWAAASARRPDPDEVSAAFARFASLKRPSELMALFAAGRRARPGLKGNRIRGACSAVEGMLEMLSNGLAPEPRPKLALEMCRFGDVHSTRQLLPYLTAPLAARLWAEPGWAFSSWDTSPESAPTARSVYPTLSLRCEASEYLLAHVPGMAPVWAARPSGWRAAFVFEFLHAHLGDDPEAWRFALSLVETWEGSFAELVEVAAVGSGSELTVIGDEPAGPPELLSERTPGVLPLVFAD